MFDGAAERGHNGSKGNTTAWSDPMSPQHRDVRLSSIVVGGARGLLEAGLSGRCRCKPDWRGSRVGGENGRR